MYDIISLAPIWLPNVIKPKLPQTT